MSRSRRRPDERGAAAVLVGASLALVLVAIAAFSVDLGMQRVARRDMQALADVIALDLARELDGRSKADLVASGDIDDATAASLGRNDGTLGDAPTVTWELGRVDDDGEFVPVDGHVAPTAVKVDAGTDVDFAFAGVIDVASGGASRSAVAQAETGACFSVSSYAARIDLGDAFILGPLLTALGGDVDLNLLDAKGLAELDVALLDLVDTDLTAGGFDELLDTTVTLGQLYLAVAEALPTSGSAAAVAVLDELATATLSSATLKLGDLVDVDTGDGAGLGAVVNAFDLVAAAAFVANGDHAIAVPSLAVDLPGGLTSLAAEAYVGQKPILKCGRPKVTSQDTAQVRIKLAGNLANVNLGVAVVAAPISLEVKVAPSVAHLDGVACIPDGRRLDFLVTSGLLSIDVLVGNPANRGAFKVKVTGINVADGYVRLSTVPAPSQTESGSIPVTGEDYDGAPLLHTGDDNIGVPYLVPDSHLAVLSNVPLVGTLVNGLLGGLVNGVVTPLVTAVVNPVVAALDATLLSPLLQALGVNVAGAEVRARPKADCGIPALRG